MRKLLAALVLLAVASFALADIHEPPKARYTKARKLGRGVSNIVYGWTEIPMTMARWHQLHTEQSSGIVTAGFFTGIQRAGARLKYGFYEVINFQRPLYKDSYRPAMPDIDYLPIRGYEEFPPQIGFLTTTGYTRGRSW
ncbi:MAG: exosortase system-associated protein, TIGR04073 family [Verrucomicrobia bacterium]|jgi:putative exosortase-associated protein (TIGR04073 family)|nr:exosortase system-associated protein, TIGR04073 family [Verrucomicrobiota bacterium]